jgi:hypothetical protein
MSRRMSFLASLARRMARVAAYFAVVTLALGTIASRRVYASAENGALAMGGALAELGDVAGPSYRVSMNGETLDVSSAMTDEPVDQVLDRFEKECREHAGGLDAQLAALPQALKAQLPAEAKGAAGAGVIRTRQGDRGMVACVARDAGLGYEGTISALARFAKTADLADLGKLRYVLAERMPSGRTHVLGAWTDGSFRLGRMFPASGDCPGSDLPGGFRPDGSRRILAAAVEGAPYGVRVYLAAGTPEQVLVQYGRGMAAAGWEPVPAVDRPLNGRGMAFLRGDVDVLVSAQPSRDGSSAVVTVVSMPPHAPTPPTSS